MVNIKECEFGNYFGYESEIYLLVNVSKYSKIRKINTGESNPIEVPLTDLEPIPISIPLLEKCGFEEHTIYNEDQDERDFYVHSKFSDLMYVDGVLKNGLDELPDIIYLHQLQNLYFDLTGEELEINLTLISKLK